MGSVSRHLSQNHSFRGYQAGNHLGNFAVNRSVNLGLVNPRSASPLDTVLDTSMLDTGLASGARWALFQAFACICDKGTCLFR